MAVEFLKKHVYGVASELLDLGCRAEVHAGEHRKTIENALYETSVIVPFNHLSLIDPLLMMRELRRSFPDAPRIVLPATMKFFDGRMGEAAKTGMERYAEKYGIELLPIIQHYDTEYEEGEKEFNHYTFYRHVIGALRSPGTIFTLAPEGTRSRTGCMNEAQAGIASFMKRSPNSLVAPVALQGTERTVSIKNSVPNPFNRSHIIYCEPKCALEFTQEASALRIKPEDLVMLELANQLSVEYRGEYGTPEFDWYYEMQDTISK